MGAFGTNKPPNWVQALGQSGGAQGSASSGHLSQATIAQMRQRMMAQAQAAQYSGGTAYTVQMWKNMIMRPTAPNGETSVFELRKQCCDHQMDSLHCFCFTKFSDYKRPRASILDEYNWVRDKHGMPGATRWINGLSDTERSMLREILDGPAVTVQP